MQSGSLKHGKVPLHVFLLNALYMMCSSNIPLGKLSKMIALIDLSQLASNICTCGFKENGIAKRRLKVDAEFKCRFKFWLYGWHL